MLVPVWSLSSGVNSTPTPMVSSSVGGGNLRYFILPSTAAGQLPPARHHDSSPHAGPRLPSDPAHLWVRAGAVQHSRPAADGLPGPPEAHHVCVGGECGTSLWGHARTHGCSSLDFLSRIQTVSSLLPWTCPCVSTCGIRRTRLLFSRAVIICLGDLTDGPGNWLFSSPASVDWKSTGFLSFAISFVTLPRMVSNFQHKVFLCLIFLNS